MTVFWCWPTPSTGNWRTGSGTVWPALTAWGSPPSHGMEDGLCWTPSKRYVSLKITILLPTKLLLYIGRWQLLQYSVMDDYMNSCVQKMLWEALASIKVVYTVKTLLRKVHWTTVIPAGISHQIQLFKKTKQGSWLLNVISRFGLKICGRFWALISLCLCLSSLIEIRLHILESGLILSISMW